MLRVNLALRIKYSTLKYIYDILTNVLASAIQSRYLECYSLEKSSKVLFGVAVFQIDYTLWRCYDDKREKVRDHREKATGEY